MRVEVDIFSGRPSPFWTASPQEAKALTDRLRLLTGISSRFSKRHLLAWGTPFISFFTPAEMLALARDAGFKEVQHVSAAMLAQRYFAGRTDGLRPPRNSEELLVATT